jgi:hypothetical protein
MSFLSAGFWPFYSIRVGWRCVKCRRRAENQKLHLVGRGQGGLKTIVDIASDGFCQTCQNQVTFRRNVLPAHRLHQILSFSTVGTWPIFWLGNGWQCTQCGRPAEDETFSETFDNLRARVYCKACQKETTLSRKLPTINLRHRMLSFFTAGSWHFNWIRFGWRCNQCGSGIDDEETYMSVDYISSAGFCKKCKKKVSIGRKTPSVNVLHRILSIFSAGYWPVYWIGRRWKCETCGKKAESKVFKEKSKALF